MARASGRDRKPAAVTTLLSAVTSHGCAIKAAPPLPAGTRQAACHSGEKEANGRLVAFKSAPSWFRPTMTPREMLKAGMHGGIYFNPLGGKPGVKYPRSKYPKGIPGVTIDEFPREWFAGVPKELYTSRRYDTSHNCYRVKSGLDQAGWESSGWINQCDPRGWTQWYFRFYNGRRLSGGEDERQMGRWNGVCGEKGRWKSNLVAKCLRDGKAFDDASVSPVVRQTLLHWAYQLTEADFGTAAKRVSKKGAAYVPRDQLVGVVGKKRACTDEDEDEDEDATELSGAAKRQRSAAQFGAREERAKRRAANEAAGGVAASGVRERGPRSVGKRAATGGGNVGGKGRRAEVAPLSAYELEREATKARNELKLEELGLK